MNNNKYNEFFQGKCWTTKYENAKSEQILPVIVWYWRNIQPYNGENRMKCEYDVITDDKIIKVLENVQ